MAGNPPRPASSVYLKYKDVVINSDAGDVSCEAELMVKHTANQTYFCCLQFYPGGYCGIQQRDDSSDRVAIFSLWNDGTNNVSCISSGPGVTVETFGGEGTGLKSMKTFQWATMTPVKFMVTAQKISNQYEVQCHYMYNGVKYHMATFRRSGSPPIRGFTSFVEDWNRQTNAFGAAHRRECLIQGVSYGVGGPKIPVHKAQFDVVTTGDDGFASSICGAYKSAADPYNSISLWTGGDKDTSHTCPDNTEFSF